MTKREIIPLQLASGAAVPEITTLQLREPSAASSYASTLVANLGKAEAIDVLKILGPEIDRELKPCCYSPGTGEQPYRKGEGRYPGAAVGSST